MGKTGGKEQIKINKKKLYKKWRSIDSNLYPKVYDFRKIEKKLSNLPVGPVGHLNKIASLTYIMGPTSMNSIICVFCLFVCLCVYVCIY